jgi:hypothetical protein
VPCSLRPQAQCCLGEHPIPYTFFLSPLTFRPKPRAGSNELSSAFIPQSEIRNPKSYMRLSPLTLCLSPWPNTTSQNTSSSTFKWMDCKDRKNINRGFKKLRVWQDAVSLYVLTSKMFGKFPFELRRVAANGIDAAHSISRNTCPVK